MRIFVLEIKMAAEILTGILFRLICLLHIRYADFKTLTTEISFSCYLLLLTPEDAPCHEHEQDSHTDLLLLSGTVSYCQAQLSPSGLS